MTTYGLLDTGFAPKPQAVCREEINTSIRAVRGPSTDVSDGSFLGQLIGIFSEREGALWDLGQAIVASQDPDQAVDAAQDALCALTGTFRAAARKSTVTETLTGTPATVIPAGTQIKTDSTGALFVTSVSTVIATLAAWAVTTAYVVGDRVTNASRAYHCITAGTSAGSGGPTTTSADITDGTVHWQYLGEGTGAVDVLMLSDTADAIVAVASDLSDIQTPIGGLSTAINLEDAELGAPQQSNESLRVTRETELAQSGSGTADAIRADLLQISGVTAVTVYHNDTDAVDANGQPAHSVQALVQGGTDAAIATVLLQNVGAGIATFGTSNAVVNDSQDTAQTFYFTRPAAVDIYIDITLTYNPASAAQGGYPATGDALVKAALVAFGAASLPAGKNVVATSLGAAIFPLYVNAVLVQGVQGVLDVPRAGSVGGTLIKTSATPTLDTTIVITPFQIASIDTSRITVHSSAGSL